MSTILIADAGSTKVHWVELSDATIVAEFFTPGVNPSVMSETAIAQTFATHLTPQLKGTVDAVEFYGAGCRGTVENDVIKRCLATTTGITNATVASDMLGACRGVLDKGAGIVAILGTGANSCVYNGREVIDNVSPGGYILGDEGSGAWLGKQLVSNYIKQLLPASVHTQFQQRYKLDTGDIIQRVYKPAPGEQAPNRFLASFAPFISENIHEPAIAQIVDEGFDAFFKRNISHYLAKADSYGNIDAEALHTVHFIGSIASVFQAQLRNAAQRNGLNIGRIILNPMEGLIARATEKQF